MKQHSLTRRLLWKPPLFTLQRLARWLKRRPAHDRGRNGLRQLHPCFFILSTGRAGTETLAVLLNRSPEALVYHEPIPTLFGLSKLAYVGQDSDLQMLSHIFYETRRPLFEHSLACGLGYGETGSYATFLAYVISEAIPQAKFVHVVRDPRAVIRSAMRRRWYRGHTYDAMRVTPRLDNPWAKAWKSWSLFEKNIWLWAETNRYILKFTSSVGSERTILLKAEDLFASDLCVVSRVFKFLGLTPPSDRVVRQLLARPLNKQISGSFPALEHWSSSMRSKPTEIAGSEMECLGYEVAGPRQQTSLP